MTRWKPELLEVLRAWGADETDHSGRTLLDHLVGTADLLHAWGNPEPLCHVGLFHSVYGTRSFQIQTVPLERRAEVAALVGPEVERLAFLFCVLDRRGLREAPDGADVILRDHATGAPRPVTAAELHQLLEVEVANVLDQLGPRSEATASRERYMEDFDAAVRARVSPGAAAALQTWLTGGDRPPPLPSPPSSS